MTFIAKPHYPGGIASVETVDAFVHSIGGDSSDYLAQKQKGQKEKTVRTEAYSQASSPASSMALEMLRLALVDAMIVGTNWKAAQHRRSARKWLRDGNAELYSARLCFEAIGGDYDAAMKRIEAAWKRNDANMISQRHAERGRGHTSIVAKRESM